MWRERGISAWGEGWWEMSVSVGDQLGRILGAAARLDRHAPERDRRRGDRALVLPATGRAEPDRLRGGELPLGALPLPGQSGARGRRRRRRPRRSWTRSTSGRCSSRSATSSSGTPRSRTSSRSCARAHEVGAHGRARLLPVRRHRPRSTLPRSASTSPSAAASNGSAAGPAPAGSTSGPDLAERLEPTLVGWQGHARPFAFEPEIDYADGSAPVPDRDAERPRALCGRRGLRRDRGGRRRADPRAFARADPAPDRPLRRGRPRGREPARAGPPRRHRPRLGRPTTPAVIGSSASAGSICDFRPEAGIRLGPHFFNSEDEVRRATDELADIVATGAYARHTGAAARF